MTTYEMEMITVGEFIANMIFFFIRVFFVMLIVGGIHHDYYEPLPPFGFSACLAFTVLFSLMTARDSDSN